MYWYDIGFYLQNNNALTTQKCKNTWRCCQLLWKSTYVFLLQKRRNIYNKQLFYCNNGVFILYPAQFQLNCFQKKSTK